MLSMKNMIEHPVNIFSSEAMAKRMAKASPMAYMEYVYTYLLVCM